MEQYEVWYQDGRTRKMRVVYVMASSFAEARKNFSNININPSEITDVEDVNKEEVA